MSPEREIDETKGANPPEKIAEEAKEAKAEQAKPRRRARKKAAEPEAAAPKAKAKPRRRTRKKTEEPEAAEQPKAEAAEAPAAEKAEEKQAEKPEEEQADEKAKAPRPTPDARRLTPTNGAVQVRARARYVRTSARKARLVCDHIRGKSVPEARAILGFTPRAAARDWTKVLESAVANAEANHELIGDELKIAEAYADEGPTLKRYRPRAMGRATRIHKRTSHLTITLAPVASEAKERS
jgi:ribosomal protein L22